MNLLAQLSADQNRPVGEMSWFATVVPLISLQIDNEITTQTTCGELLSIILDLDPKIRKRILQVSVHDTEESDEKLEKAKEKSHKQMLVWVAAVFTALSGALVVWFVLHTSVKGEEVSEGTINTILTVIKHIVDMLLGVQ